MKHNAMLNAGHASSQLLSYNDYLACVLTNVISILIMEYFGTNLTEAGHYRWNINNDFFQSGSLNFNGLPFHPEELTNHLSKGETIFYQGGGFTVLGISGSCSDNRNGTKSIFWVNWIISKPEIINKIKNNPLAVKIIEKMSFKVNW